MSAGSRSNPAPVEMIVGGSPISSSNPLSIATNKQIGGGLSRVAFRTTTATNVNAVNAKGTAGQVYAYHFMNAATSARFVHFYDKATAPTMGTDADVRVVPIPAGGSISYQIPYGSSFANGIQLAVTAGSTATDNTTTGIAVGDVTGMVDFA